ncbi:MAG: peptide deformylase [Erysipelotrichaceae bacterium]|nr:peptide deformylase [Erysipelotrichaceae bacterium]
MNKPIVRDVFFLSQKSQETTKDDLNDVRNLVDTFMANRQNCVGMAANMIGVKKRFIVVEFMNMPLVMINPKIISKKERYETEEGCLSLNGMRKAVRYREIAVAYQDMQFQSHTQTFSGFTAQIIQHEIDHCDGIVI